MKRHIFKAADLQKFTNDLFVAAGTPQHIADTVAEILIKANLAGHDSHGVLRIPSYLEAIEGGGIRPDAEPNTFFGKRTTRCTSMARTVSDTIPLATQSGRRSKKRNADVPASQPSSGRDISADSVNTVRKLRKPDVSGLLQSVAAQRAVDGFFRSAARSVLLGRTRSLSGSRQVMTDPFSSTSRRV